MTGEELANNIVCLLIQAAEEEIVQHNYINPNFIWDIRDALYDYYEVENDIVDKYIDDMFSC